jgi:hypothetical protein
MGSTAFPNGVTADVVGNVTGDVTGAVQRPVSVASANGAISIKDGYVVLTKAGVAAMTLADPTATTDDGKELTVIAVTANAHTVTIAGGMNGAGAGADVGTFGGAVGDRFSVVAYNGKWYASGVNVNVTFA